MSQYEEMLSFILHDLRNLTTDFENQGNIAEKVELQSCDSICKSKQAGRAEAFMQVSNRMDGILKFYESQMRRMESQ